MAKLVTTAKQAIENIRKYERFVSGHEALKDRTGLVRAWYAVRDKEEWRFGSSKICGYKDLTAQDYLSGGHDGRQTEAVLSKWFREVPTTEPLYQELHEALSDFLGKFGKKPSKLARVSVLKAELESTDQDRDDALVALILEVAKGLDTDRIKLIRSQLKAFL